MIACCTECGSEFFPSFHGHEQCSKECAQQARRKEKRERAFERADKTAFKDPQRRCRAPWCHKEGVHQHHVVYEQEVRHRGGDVADPDDALSTCLTCHADHHGATGRTLPLTCLRDENIAYAFRLMGEAAAYYLWRHYEGDDPRVHVALTELAVQGA